MSAKAIRFVVSVALGVMATACGQGAGSVCQINADCQSGLVCCKLSTRLEDRGVCRAEGASCASATDSATDSATTDGNVGDSSSDAVVVDAASADARQDATSDANATGDANAASDATADTGNSDAEPNSADAAGE